MSSKLCFLLFFIHSLTNAFSMPQQQESDFYYIVNNSNEDLLITVKNKEILINWDILGGYYVNYYENGIIVDRIYLTANFGNEDYLLQDHILPYNNRYVEGRFYWKYRYFFRRLTSERIYQYNSREHFIEARGEENAEQFPYNTIFRYRKLSGYETLEMFIEELLVTDIFGNTIISLDDINETYFEENIVINNIEEYTDDFYNLPGYRNFMEEDRNILLYGIFITEEMVQEGRKKYFE